MYLFIYLFIFLFTCIHTRVFIHIFYSCASCSYALQYFCNVGHIYVVKREMTSMRGSRNFRQGVQLNLTKKALTTFFFNPQLILLKSNGIFRRKLWFFKVPEGVLHFPRVPTFPRGGGSNCLFPIETHIPVVCDFPGGSGPPVPPLDPHLTSHHLMLP